MGQRTEVPVNFWKCETETGRNVTDIVQGVRRRSPRRSIERGFEMKLASFIVLCTLATSPVAAQTAGTSTSQVCTQDPTYRSDTGATESTTTTGGAAGSSASSGGSGGEVQGAEVPAAEPAQRRQRSPTRRAEMACLWMRGVDATE
jgi:hypothetical protein